MSLIFCLASFFPLRPQVGVRWFRSKLHQTMPCSNVLSPTWRQSTVNHPPDIQSQKQSDFVSTCNGKVIAFDGWMDGWMCMYPAPTHCTFCLPFVLDFRPLTSGRHLKFSLMRSIKFSCLVLGMNRYYSAYRVHVVSPDVTLSGWLGSKHQPNN